MEKLIYPKGETVWVRHFDSQGSLRYITTSTKLRDCYYLYELKDGKFQKLGKSKNPRELEEKYIKNLS